MSDTNSLAKVGEVVDAIRGWSRGIKAAMLAALVVGSSYMTTKFSQGEKPVATPAAAAKEETKQPQQGTPEAKPVVASPVITNQPANPGQTTVSFLVQSVGRNRSGKAFLNSQTDYRAAGNQTIVLTGPAAGANLDSYKGKMVTASGVVSYYRGQAQVEVNDLSQLR